jgi:N-acetylglucosaminyldiphosphoundecaprenol N-acetyl-beta-D-mannosaminyltransferase
VSASSTVAVLGMPPTRELFGIPIAALTLEETLNRVDLAVSTRTRLQIGVVNAAKIVNMRRDETLRQDVLSSDLILADGIAVVWASRLLGVQLPERVPGIDLMEGILRRGRTRGYRIYCLGAEEDVLEKAADRMAADHVGVEIVGRQHGYFSVDQEEDVVRAIREARPDVLFVAMTSPIKEQFLARWSGVLGVPVCHGVGGSFDVLAGKVKRAPRVWQRMGLEWLYRVVQEPRRLSKRYLVTNTLFCGMLAQELARRPARRP